MDHIRNIGGVNVSAMGLGCMNLSHAYGVPPSENEAIKLLHTAYDMGVRHFDTAALYGFGKNEILVGKAFAGRWADIHLASKCGMTGVDGKRVIDGRSETLEKTIDASLSRLGVDHIHLYYLHRWNKNIPIEESVGALSKMVEQGKISAIGLSEVCADTLRKAHAIHPITALQSEYSLWTRNPEIAVLKACKELQITFVAFSPLGRGFLTQDHFSRDQLIEGDIRLGMPRFSNENISSNQKLIDGLLSIATDTGLTPAQVSLAWILAKGEHVLPIPGTRSIAHLKENLGAVNMHLSEAHTKYLDDLFSPHNVNGDRYPAETQAEIDTENFK